MAQACTSCGGVGWGLIDPEFGFRGGEKPCRTCNPDGLGRFIPIGPGMSQTVDFLDAKAHESGGEYDPGVVNTGNEVVSIDQALAMTSAEGE
jgi:hypothetical protein